MGSFLSYEENQDYGLWGQCLQILEKVEEVTEKHSSLTQYRYNYCRKKFNSTGQGPCCNHFNAIVISYLSKLNRFCPLESLPR
jgi:hypothetical protein